MESTLARMDSQKLENAKRPAFLNIEIEYPNIPKLLKLMTMRSVRAINACTYLPYDEVGSCY